MQTDLMGNPRISIKDNPVLENACNRLLIMVKNDPELVKGDTMGTIDRRIYAELLWEDCFKTLIDPAKKHVFVKALTKAPESDVFTRARRELLSRNLLPGVSPKAIVDAERHRARIAEAMK